MLAMEAAAISGPHWLPSWVKNICRPIWRNIRYLPEFRVGSAFGSDRGSNGVPVHIEARQCTHIPTGSLSGARS